MGRKTLLTVQQRVDILKELEESSIAYVAGKYNVHPKTIKRIQKCAAEINSFAEKGHLEKRRKNLKLPRFDELEQRLSVWFAERRAMGDTLSDVLLLEKAGELKEELESCSNFKVSAGWLAKFKRRHHIRLVHIYGEKVSANENDLTICSEQEQRLSGTFEERTAEEGDEETAIEEEDEERAAEEKDQENGLKLHPRIRKDFEDVFKDLEHLKKYIPHSAQCHVDGLKLTVLDMESFLELFGPGSERDTRKETWNDSENEENGMSDCENSSTNDDQEERLPPEPEQGNIEYKLKLINPSSQRFEHLVTQMKWRLREGHGEAIYQIGVEDNGRLTGLTREDMKASLKTLNDMAARLGATTTILRERLANSKNKDISTHSSNKEERSVAEILVKKLRKGDGEDQDSIIDLRLAVTGAQDAGKSTLLGVLTQGELDNGRGRARLNMLRHLHEIKTGRTSSISHEIVGFDSEGHMLNYAEMATAEEICEHASKVVTFIDLAGHRKYLRTTVLGLTGYSPHHVMLVVAPPINEASQEHMALCLTLGLPIFIVVNKIDLGLCSIAETITQLENAISAQGYSKQLLMYNDGHIPWDYESDVIPVFNVSCVTGEGLENLTNFIKNLSPHDVNSTDSESESCLFQIDETFRVAGLNEPVLGGLLVKGAIAPGTRLLVGPLPDGEFSPVKVVSLHRNKAPCCLVRASQSASLTLAPPNNRSPPLPHLRPGMVLVSLWDQPHATLFFQATVLIVYHATAIYSGFQTTVHVGNVRQTCIIKGIMDAKDKGLQTNDKASVLFRFVNHPEYLHVGMRLLLREGRTKGIGKITQIFPLIGPQNSIQ